MKIVVLGATGGVGKELVSQAAAIGHEVIALGRSLRTGVSGTVHSVTGDAKDVALVEDLVKGADVVVMTIGLGRVRDETFVLSEAAKNITSAMQTTGVKRLIALSASAAFIEPNDTTLNQRVLKPTMWLLLGYLYADTVRMEQVVSTSNTDWTLLRLSRLTNGKHTGTYRTAYNESVLNGSHISRADVADYILRHLTDTQDYRQHVSIAY